MQIHMKSTKRKDKTLRKNEERKVPRRRQMLEEERENNMTSELRK